MTTLVRFGHTYQDAQGQNHQLVVAQEENREIDWSEHGVTITEGQLKTISNLPAVLAVLTNSWKQPSGAAGILTVNISHPVIHTINADFRKAKTNYKNMLAVAERNDLNTFTNLNTKYKIKSFSGFWGFFRKIAASLGANYKCETEAAKEASLHRFAFMVSVSALENKRLEEIKDKITENITPLLVDVERIQREHQEDLPEYGVYLRQLQQLTAIFTALFPADDYPEAINNGLGILEAAPRQALGLAAISDAEEA